MTGPVEQWARVVRLVQVVLVCAGLVAMHQMGSSSHQMIMPAAAAGAVHGTMAGETSAPNEIAAIGAVVELAAATTGPVSGAEATCMAVLLGLLVLSARMQAVVTRADSAASSPGTAHGSIALGRGPPRLLLAKICVLRT